MYIIYYVFSYLLCFDQYIIEYACGTISFFNVYIHVEWFSQVNWYIHYFNYSSCFKMRHLIFNLLVSLKYTLLMIIVTLLYNRSDLKLSLPIILKLSAHQSIIFPKLPSKLLYCWQLPFYFHKFNLLESVK